MFSNRPLNCTTSGGHKGGSGDSKKLKKWAAFYMAKGLKRKLLQSYLQLVVHNAVRVVKDVFNQVVVYINPVQKVFRGEERVAYLPANLGLELADFVAQLTLVDPVAHNQRIEWRVPLAHKHAAHHNKLERAGVAYTAVELGSQLRRVEQQVLERRDIFKIGIEAQARDPIAFGVLDKFYLLKHGALAAALFVFYLRARCGIGNGKCVFRIA